MCQAVFSGLKLQWVMVEEKLENKQVCFFQHLWYVLVNFEIFPK